MNFRRFFISERSDESAQENENIPLRRDSDTNSNYLSTQIMHPHHLNNNQQRPTSATSIHSTSTFATPKMNNSRATKFSNRMSQKQYAERWINIGK